MFTTFETTVHMHKYATFTVLIVVTTKNTVAWNVMPCASIEIHQYFNTL
jgi:hypothetical protein